MIKGPLHQEDITILNLYAPSFRTPKYIKQILIDRKGETDSSYYKLWLKYCIVYLVFAKNVDLTCSHTHKTL